MLYLQAHSGPLRDDYWPAEHSDPSLLLCLSTTLIALPVRVPGKSGDQTINIPDKSMAPFRIHGLDVLWKEKDGCEEKGIDKWEHITGGRGGWEVVLAIFLGLYW